MPPHHSKREAATVPSPCNSQFMTDGARMVEFARLLTEPYQKKDFLSAEETI